MTTEALTDLSRLSLNQTTTESWSLAESVAGCVRHSIPSIAPWRHKVAEVGVGVSARMIKDAGLTVSSLCRGGFFPAATAAERAERIDDNRRAVDEAAALGTDVLVLVCGPAPDRDLDAARQMVVDGIAATIDHASAAGVKLAVEPLHPMFAADRSVIVTLAQALAIAEQFPAESVGVVVDVYHVWWDPEVYNLISRASRRILGLQVSDWLSPPPDLFLGRGMMGDGVIELRRLRGAVDAAGYSGAIEVEIINRAVWDTPGDRVLETVKERFLEHV